jgi:hypothetical protein
MLKKNRKELILKKIVTITGLGLTVALMLTLAISSIAFASSGPMGPAPNSGDCVPDGSGFELPNGPNADIGLGLGPMGPAPNSGDGIPDGSGF